jgi:hypothetical protein
MDDSCSECHGPWDLYLADYKHKPWCPNRPELLEAQRSERLRLRGLEVTKGGGLRRKLLS